MRRIAAILLCIAMCLTVMPWVAHAEGTAQYAAVTATEPDGSDANLFSLGDPEGGGGDPPGGGAGAFEGMSTEDADHYVVSSDCTVSPEDSVDLRGCSITVNEGVVLTVEAGARIELRDGVFNNKGTILVHGNLEINDGAELINDEDASIVVENFLRLSGGAQLSNSGSVTVEAGGRVEVTGAVFNNEGTIDIEADTASNPPEHGRIEIRDDRYYDEEAEEDIVTPGVLVNQGTITVGGNLEITDGAELINDEDASIVVENFLRLSGGAQLSNSGSVTVKAGASAEVTGAVFTNNGTIVIEADQAGDSPEHGRIEVRDDRYPDEEVTHGELENHGTITVCGNLEINDGAELVNDNDEDASIVVENFLRLSGGAQLSNSGSVTVKAGGRVEVTGAVFNNEGTIDIEADTASNPPEHGRIEIRDDRYYDEEAEEDIVTPGVLVNQGTITVGGNLEITDGAELINDEDASIVVENFLRLSGGAQLSNSGSVTVKAGASAEVTGAVFTNNGTIVIEADQAGDSPEHGRIEVRDDRYPDEEVTHGELENHGTITVCGNLEINDGAELVNDNDEDASIVVENFLRLSGGAQLSNSGSVTVKAGASAEVTGAVFTNNGTIVIEADQAGDSPEHGRIEIRDDRYYDEEAEEDIVTPGVLVNQGTITVGGNLEITDGAELINDEGAGIFVDNFMRLAGGAQLSNSGSVTGGEHGHIELFVDDHSGIRLTISGLGFYDSPGDAASDDPITDNLRGSFSYDSVAHKWIRSEGPGGGGGDPGGEGPRPWRIYTDFGIHGWVDGPRDVDDGGDATFTLMPDEGFVVGPVTVTRQETGTPWDSVGLLTDEGDGTCSIVVMNVTEDLILSVTFVSETPPTVDSILQKSYAILVADADSPEAVEAALRGEIDGLGYVDGFDVTVTDIDLPGDGEDYGTFRFTVAAGVEISPETTGYIVREPSNILFKVVGEHESLEANEVLMADSDDAQLGVFELPAMDSGIIEVLGVYSAGVEGWLSPDVADGALTGDRYRIVATQPFYRLQMHIANRPANPADEVNWFGFDVIQADAYCVFVDASDGAGQQRTLQWELNRYAQLTTGDYTSQVFFGNDRFTLSLPPNGLGGVTEFSTPTGTFQGYQVSHDEGNPVDPTDDTYTVEFLSDFYDRITLEITINGSVTRKIHIHRVGVEINAFDLYGENRPDQVFHGTQYGSKVHYDDGTAYHIFATYCIPDGEDVPYGLYVTFTWADGSTTTKIIGAPYDPHKDPVDPVAHLFDSDRGVFVYPEHADPVDYLIYEAPTSAGAPVKVNVLVLKDDPNASGIFGGVFFGSGAGVEWQAD